MNRISQFAVSLCLVAASTAAYAQVNLLGQFNSAVQSAKKGQASNVNSPVTLQAWRGTAPPTFTNKANLLMAAGRGELLGLADVHDNGIGDRSQIVGFVASIAVILANDYQTAIPDDARSGGCVLSATHTILPIFSNATAKYTSSLSTNPPNFSKPPIVLHNDGQLPSLVNSCSSTVLGTKRQYLAIDSLIALLAEYEQATNNAVEAKRAKLASDYQATLAAKQAAAQKLDADRRAVEQQRIDAEAARIKQQQEDIQKKQDANRVSG